MPYYNLLSLERVGSTADNNLWQPFKTCMDWQHRRRKVGLESLTCIDHTRKALINTHHYVDDIMSQLLPST